MGATVSHAYSLTQADGTATSVVRPSDWNSGHILTLDSSLTNINVSAGTTSNNLSRIVFSDSNGVSFGLNGSTVTGTVQTNYLTTAALSGHSHGDPTLNLTNLSGTTASNSAGLTLSLSAAAPGGAQTAISGISQSQTMYTSGTVLFSEQANITINSSVNGASQYLRFSVAAPGGAGAARSYFNWPEVVANSSAIQISGSSKYVQPIEIPHDLSVSYVRFPITLSCVGSLASFTTAANQTVGLTVSSTFQLAFYSLGVGANSRSLQSYFTTSTGWVQQARIDAGGTGSRWTSGHTISFGGESGQATNFTSSGGVSQTNRSINTTQLTNFTNLRFLNIPMATSFSAGMYWMAWNSSTQLSSSQNANITTVRILASNFAMSQPAQSFNLMGSATNSSNLFPIGQGNWSTNSIGTTTGSIGLANISRRLSNPILFFDMIRQA